MTIEKFAKKKIKLGASVLFAHELYARPKLENCKKLARRLGVPIVVKLPSAQQRLVEKLVRSCFMSNGVKKPAVAAVRYFARQVKYIATYVTPHGTLLCFVLDEYAEDILFPAYFNRAAHDDALHNETSIQAQLEEIEELCKDQ